MRFIVDVPKSKIIETIVKEDEITEEEITNEDLCDFILSSIGIQIDNGSTPKTEISVMVVNPPI